MYSRVYGKENDSKILIPDGYDGTAFSDGGKDDIRRSVSEVSDIPADTAGKEAKISLGLHTDTGENEEAESEDSEPVFGFAKGGFMPLLKNLIPKSFRFNKEEPFSFDFEDLLIIGIALFLIFSKEGDRELGLMLALLVFIS